jgi:nucleotide-binding universal stress UspA family protein
MTPLTDRYRIVVALDLSEYAEVVLEHAIDQAARHEAVDLHFIVVQERAGESIDDLKSRLAPVVFEGLALLGEHGPDWRARLHVRTGRPDEEIAGLAAEIGADLVVVGRFGRHHGRGRLGSIAAKLVETSPCPVLVVGLTEHAIPAVDLCTDCAHVREESDGERWFCDAHSAPVKAVAIGTNDVATSGRSGAGPMW